MSADNLYGVWQEDEHTWCVAHLFASPLGEDCMYLKTVQDRLSNKSKFWTREQALVNAHDRIHMEMGPVEYGVCELPPATEEPCGECSTCINVRHLTAATTEQEGTNDG